jgi:hypothetical protein
MAFTSGSRKLLPLVIEHLIFVSIARNQLLLFIGKSKYNERDTLI